MSFHCKRCGLIVLKEAKGTPYNETEPLVLEKGTDGATEDISAWLRVADMFQFENCAFTRDSKHLPGGLRLLTCGGCEQGIIGKANPSGEGQNVTMESFVAISRLEKR